MTGNAPEYISGSGELNEDLESFRARTKEWVRQNLLPLDGADPVFGHAKDDADHLVRAKALQRRLWDAGFAGLCYPAEYGGRALPVAYQNVFNEATRGYELPNLFNTPTFTIILPTILEFGTEEQKQRYIPAALSGAEVWVQFLSEPTGGSDLAGVLTRADRDADKFILNGSKVWSTYAWKSDYALCVCRTDWDAPKHRGLSVLIVKVHQPGVTIKQIKHVDGTADFCQEFFDDVPVPADGLLGQENDGWNVTSRLLFHERAAVSGSSPYQVGPRTADNKSDQLDVAALTRVAQGADEQRVRRLTGEARMLMRVHSALVGRIGTAMRIGRLPAAAGSIPRLSNGMLRVRLATIAMEIAGDRAVAWDEGDPAGELGIAYLGRQGVCLGGGTTEIARNIISERLLGMPREAADDVHKPFRQVRTNAAAPRGLA
jgi:alkylation response protein AidB-like acyl-CoA dehydrogenase